MKPSKAILPEYLTTRFVHNIREDEDRQWPSEFWIITACNPHSAGEREGDDASTKRLRKELSRLGCWKLALTAVSQDWAHSEKSFAVKGLSREEVLALGLKYGQNAVFHVVGDRLSVVACEGGEEVEAGQFRERLRTSLDRPAFRIYVVRLSDEVLQVKRFRAANPNYKRGKPCYYVGMTGRTPDERFAQHLEGYKSCSLVRKFGQHLARKKFEGIPPLCHAEAVKMEVSHAEALRAQGHAVWQK
ncbi:MAG: hypothetical protein RL346_1899 [Verrucomicrobiota bacterium]